MNILLCTEVEQQFSSYMDGTLSGASMAEMHEHMRHCVQCSVSFAAWQRTMDTLATLGPAKAPADLALRLRVVISREKARTPRAAFDRLKMHWQHSLGPLAVRASAGLASAIIMLGTTALLVGTFATPQPAVARSQPLSTATQPRFLYVSEPGNTGSAPVLDGSVVLRVYVDARGQAYDYRVLSGADTDRNHSAVADEMLWSVFAPAQAFGEPVRGSMILSLAGISVPG